MIRRSHRRTEAPAPSGRRFLSRCTSEDTIILWHPVGSEEFALIEANGIHAFPPRLPEQPIFYPVLDEAYAIRIARDWNVSGCGHVTRFAVRKTFLDAYRVQEAGGSTQREYWIPAEDLAAFNAAIVGPIEVTRSFPE